MRTLHGAWVPGPAALAAIICLSVRSSVAANMPSIYDTSGMETPCVAWRHTLACSPFG